MREQVQRQTRRRDEEAEAETTGYDRSQTDEVLEGCDDCLSAIDEVLEDVDNREPTDLEVYEAGRPNPYDDKYWDGPRGRHLLAQYNADLARYGVAYENVTGLTFDPCTC